MSISVVIPAYNAERFLGEAIESVLSQTRRPEELIVIDDGSTDGTLAVARRYPEVTAISQPDGGPSAARNRGISKSDGDLICFHDAEDLMEPEKLSIQAGLMDDNPQLGCVMTTQSLLHEPGAELPFWSPGSDVPVRRIAPDTWTLSEHLPGLGGSMIRRAAAVETGGFDEELSHAEDLDFLQRATERGVVMATIVRPLMVRRIHGDILTQDPAASRAAMFLMPKKQIERNRAQNPSDSGSRP